MNGPLADPLRVHGDRFVAPGMLDFAVNVWPAERPRRLRDALVEALGCVGYPDERAARLAIARRHARPPAETLPLSGACDGFWVLATGLRARHAACVHPCFTEAEAALRAAGTRLTRVLRRADEGWALAPERVPVDADLVVLVNPNNPTGNLDRADRIALLARPGGTLVVDESFIDFVGDRAASLAPCRDLPGLAAIETCVPDAETPARIAAEVASARNDLCARLAVRTPAQHQRLAAAIVRATFGGAQGAAGMARFDPEPVS